MERTFPNGNGDERAVLTGWLDWQRATVHRKVAGLSEEYWYQTLLPTSPRMTIAGETARNLGHLDVLREQLDGTRGY